MRKNLRKGRAVLSAWSFAAVMGLTPVLSAASPAAAAVVYAKETGAETSGTEENEKGKRPKGDEEEKYRLASPSDAEKEPEETDEQQNGSSHNSLKEEQETQETQETQKPEEALPEKAEQREENQQATPSNAIMMLANSSLWGRIEMSDHLDGEGTEEEPYEINSANDLRLLAYNVANEEVDGYAGCYFILTRDISLSDTASWLPIGYFTETGDSEPMPFKGNFDGQGYRIYNLKISDTTQDYAGLFGCLHGATIKNMTVDGQVNANSKAAILAGEINDSVIQNCTSLGQVRGVGAIGGIAGEAYDSVILECTNTAGVLGGTDAGAEEEAFAGGICGSAHTSFISDCTSDTTDSYSALYSEGYVGGIAGNIYETEVYNSYVEGKVGSTSADYIGGLIGRMQSGQVKNGRFAGTIGASTSSTLKTAGLFVGYIEGGTIELGDDLAYLFTDSEDKYSLNPFGNKLTPQIRLEHQIGAYYSNQRDFSLYQMGEFTKQTNKYFYEELEDGVLSIGEENVHHYAPSKTGDPVRGYLVSIPAIDHGTLSVMESQNSYAKEIDWANPGAIAAGTKVLVYTSPVNETASEPPVYYELEPDSLFWISDDFEGQEVIQTGGVETAFTMPDSNITLSATYRAMTNGVVLDRTELTFEVDQIRSGSRWDPQIGWKVTDPQKLTATVIPDSAANKTVYWSAKDTDGASTDVITVSDDGEVTVNTSAKWITDLIRAAVANQELYPSKPITTEATDYATVTVTTEAGQKRASAFVTVNFKITDQTVVPVSGVELDQAELAFEVVRTLEGDRLNPTETYSVTPAKRLYETISPEYADNKDVTWSVGDSDMIRVDGEGMVSVREDARWIADLIQAEKTANSNSPYAKSEAAGNRSSYVTVTTADGGKQAVCAVNVSFRTVDNTIAHVESVSLDQQEFTFEIEKVMTGRRSNPTVEYKVTSPVQLNAAVYPAEAENRSVAWSVDDGDVLTVSESGMVTARTDGQWIKDLEAANLYGAAGEKTALVTVTTADGGKQAQCKVTVSFKTTNNTTNSSSGGSSGGGGGGSSSGGGSSRSSVGSSSGPGASGNWIMDEVGWWYQYSDGTYPKSCWQQLSYNGTTEWYHFDERGYMQTGWFTDVDGHIYYLHPVGDGTRGRMYTGWNQIEGKWYYFNPVSDGTRGALFVNGQTPDGYRVDENGVWIP